MGKRKREDIEDVNFVEYDRDNREDQLCKSCGNEFQPESDYREPDSYLDDHYKKTLLNNLFQLMYQMDLFILCLLRKFKYRHKYPTLSLTFGHSISEKFNIITLRHNEKFFHILIEKQEQFYFSGAIDHGVLFAKANKKFSINRYFNIFVQHLISNPCSLMIDLEYFVLYTDTSLDITEKKKLRKRKFKNYYPFEFSPININRFKILKHFLVTDNAADCNFYRFSQDGTMKEELFKRLKFTITVQKRLLQNNLSQEFQKDLKETFLDNLIFVVNQSCRKKLNFLVKRETNKDLSSQNNYLLLQDKALNDLRIQNKEKESCDKSHQTLYELNSLMILVHSMFLKKNPHSINFDTRSNYLLPNCITLNYKGNITRILIYNAKGSIDFPHLFPNQKKKNKFSINDLFAIFVEKLCDSLQHIIFYTNENLELLGQKILTKKSCSSFFPLKLVKIKAQKKKLKILDNELFIDSNNLYKFSQEEKNKEKLFNLLKLPLLEKNKLEKFPSENGKEIKEKFLKKCVLAVNQRNLMRLNNVARDNIEKNSDKVPYNFEELQEIVLRWLESDDLSGITVNKVLRISEDIKNEKFSQCAKNIGK